MPLPPAIHGLDLCKGAVACSSVGNKCTALASQQLPYKLDRHNNSPLCQTRPHAALAIDQPEAPEP